MAYLEYTLDESRNHETSRKLVVQNVDGRKVDMAYWITNWQWIIGWTDNQHLALVLPQYPQGSLVILNPFTTEWKVVTPSVPVREREFWEFPNKDLYNATLTHAVYFIQDNWTLVDLKKANTLWFGEYDYYNVPKWSPDGSRFAIMSVTQLEGSDNIVGDLLFVGIDGKVDPVLRDIKIEDSWTSFSWAPDGKQFAAWLVINNIGSSYSAPKNLVLVDPQQRILTELCINQEDGDYMASVTPIWSPDGRYFAFSLQNGDEWTSGTVLVDVERQKAYRFRDNTIPMGWMAKP